MKATVYYPQVLGNDNKWHYIRNSEWYNFHASAEAHARAHARTHADSVKDHRAVSREVELDAEGKIIS